MNVNVYLPDDVGERAKQEGLNLSRMLRDAVEDELERRKSMAQLLADDVEEHLIDLEDQDGNIYSGRIRGKLIGGNNDVAVYVAEDERVILYEEAPLRYFVLEDPEEELRNRLDPDEYANVLIQLGLKPVIDI